MTKGLTKLCCAESTREANKNDSLQTKTINTYIVDIIERLAQQHPHMIEAVYIPDPTDPTDKEGTIQEKDPWRFMALMRWKFLETFIELGNDNKAYPKISSMVGPLKTTMKDNMKDFCAVNKNQDKANQEMREPDPSKLSAKQKEDLEKIKEQRKSWDEKTWFCRIENFSYFLTATKLPVPSSWNEEEAKDLSSWEHAYQMWALLHLKQSKQAILPNGFSIEWNPTEFMILSTVVGSVLTGKDSIKILCTQLNNNGLINERGFRGDYWFESGEKEPIEQVRSMK